MDIAHSALHHQAHIRPPKHTDAHAHAHAHSVSHQKRGKKSQPIMIKYLWHIVNGFVKKIAVINPLINS